MRRGSGWKSDSASAAESTAVQAERVDDVRYPMYAPIGFQCVSVFWKTRASRFSSNSAWRTSMAAPVSVIAVMI